MDIPLVLKYFREVFNNRIHNMSSPHSLLLFNVGHHYTRATNLDMVFKLIDVHIEELKRYKVSALWRGQTALNYRDKKKDFYLAFSNNQVSSAIHYRCNSVFEFYAFPSRKKNISRILQNSRISHTKYQRDTLFSESLARLTLAFRISKCMGFIYGGYY